jgi:hypothetical protein
MSTALRGIFSSQEFWTLVIDIVVSSVLYFVGKYAGPSAFEDVKFVMGLVNAMAALLIFGMFGVRVAKIRALASLAEMAYVVHDKDQEPIGPVIARLADKIEAL